MIEFFIDKGANLEYGMHLSVIEGDYLVKFFIDEGVDDWEYGLTGATTGGHPDLIDFFIYKGANDLDDALLYTDDYKIVRYLIELGAKENSEKE